MAVKPPTTELGRVTDQSVVGIPAWNTFIDTQDYVPELLWPQSVDVYQRMMATAQVGGLLRSVRLPIERYTWYLDPRDAPATRVQKLAEDLGLPIKGKEDASYLRSRRAKGRFSFKKHLTDAFRALGYGHYFFEQVGEVEDDGLWHLRKLAPRPPRTIMEINVAEDGGLVSIKQNFGPQAPEIPVERLVAYIWDMEAGQWVGRPMIRECYQNWLIKDRLLRVDAIKHERSGMGTPMAEAPPGASDSQISELNEMMQQLKVVEGGGGAVPAGTKVQLMGTTGSVPDTIASIRYHDEQMAGDFLAMFKQLGQTQTGSRALGESFIDFFELGLQAVAGWYAEVFNQHVIEDYWDWNYGEDEPAPELCYNVNDEQMGWTDLASLVTAGAIHVDPDFEEYIRDRIGAPETPDELKQKRMDQMLNPPTPPAPGDGGDGETTPPQPTPSTPPAPSAQASERRGGDGQAEAAAGPAPSLPLPARPLRRQPYDHEIAASVDFAQMDAQLSGGVEQLANEISVLQRQQIDQLHDLIVSANGSLKKLAQLSADPVAFDALYASMQRMAQVGIDQAASEAARQGVASPRTATVADVDALIQSRAKAVDELLAKNLSQSAIRQALRRTAKNVPAGDVAAKTKSYLQALKGTYLKDISNGALTGAMNTGRKAVILRNAPQAIYASEILDDNTCEACAQVDGVEYPSMIEAESDYPTGGYSDCEGLDRCRGTLIATYPEAGV